MKKIRLTAIWIVASMLLQMFGAAVYADGNYGPELLTDTGFENSTVGAKPTSPWRAYTTYNNAYAEVISKEDYPDFVYNEDKALRFISAGDNTGYGIRCINTSLISSAPVGTVFEFSAYAKTNIENEDAVLNVENTATGGCQFSGNASFALTTDWERISALYVVTEENKGKGLTLTLTTPLTTSIKESDFTGSSTAKYNALVAAHSETTDQSYIIIDDLSFHTVVTVSADNAQIHYNDNGASDDVFYASYDYDGIEEEGGSKLTWCVSNTEAAAQYEEIKTVENINAQTVSEESALILDKSYAGKYLFYYITPINVNGEPGAQVKSSAVKIEDGKSFISNSDFIKDIYGWSGDAEFVNEDSEASDASGAMKIDGDASYHVVYTDSKPADFVISLMAKGQSLSFIAGSEQQAVEITEEYKQYDFAITIGESFDFVMSGDAVVDKIRISEIKPEAKNVAISGETAVGNTIEAGYEYNSTIGIAEGDSIIKWYVSDSANSDGEEVAQGKSFTIGEEHNKKYIYFTVIPVDVDGVPGDIVRSKSSQIFNLMAYNLKIEATGNKTNDILYPSYEYSGDSAEGKTIIEWLQADSANTPDELWEVINCAASDTRGYPKANVTASTVTNDGALLLSQSQRGKYVRFRITPVDGSGKKGIPVMSECTAPIEFERNLVNNGDISQGQLGYVGDVKFSISNLNSDIDGTDDGTQSLAVDATNKKRGYDISNGEFVTNRGYDTFSYYFANIMDSNLTYDFSCDLRLDYSHDTTMSISFMQQQDGTSGGYQFKQEDIYSNKWTRVTNTVSGKSSENWGRVTVRCQGSLTDHEIVNSGKFIIDNLTLYAKQPYVTDLNVSGNAVVGGTINAEYTFNSAYDVGTEYESQIKWLISDYPWGPWETYKSVIGTDKDDYSLNITDDLQSKYIRFEVKPCDIIGTKGLEMQTTKELFVAPADGIDTEITGSMTASSTVTGNVAFDNVQNISRNITAVLAAYKDVNGISRMTNIAYNTVNVPAYGSAEFSVDLTATEEDNGSTPVLYVLDGKSMTNLKPLQSVTSPGITSCDTLANRAFADNDKKTAEYMSSTDEANMKYSVVVVRDGASITQENASENIIYFGIGRSGNDKLFGAKFDIDKAQNGDAFRVYKTNENSVADSNVVFTYYGADAAAKVVECIRNSTASDLIKYFDADNRELYDGIDIVKTLSIDISDYKNVDDKEFVLAVIATRDYSGNTSEIRKTFEEKSKAKYEEEQLIKQINKFKDEVSESDSTKIATVLRKYNDILSLNLDDECGYAYKFNTDGRKTMDSAVYTAVKKTFDSEVLDIPNEVKKNFEETVLLQVINTCGWEDMQNVLLGNSSKLNIDVDGMYTKLSTESKKTEFNKAIYTADFSTVAEFESYFVSKGNEIANSKQNTTVSGGGVGGGSSGGKGTVSNPTTALNPTPSNPNKTERTAFTDVTSAHWAYNAINSCVERGIISGYPDNTVRPDNSVTRAEFITIIMKALDIDADVKENSFNDVDESKWYNDVVSTAHAMEIINGISDDTFAPDDYIKREDMAVIVSRAVKAKAFTLPTTRNSNTFEDNADIADYAQTAIEELWCANIINGMDNNKFMPKEKVSRAMAVQIAYSLLKIL